MCVEVLLLQSSSSATSRSSKTLFLRVDSSKRRLFSWPSFEMVILHNNLCVLKNRKTFYSSLMLPQVRYELGSLIGSFQMAIRPLRYVVKLGNLL